MSYKDLLVHLDNSDICEQRIDAAIALAKRQEARLTGIALALESTISTYIGIDFPASLNEQQQEIVKQAAQEAVDRFTAKAKAAGIQYRVKTVACPASKAPEMLAFYARHADLTFVGQPNPDKRGKSFHEALMNGVLHQSGRPVYMVPYIGVHKHKVRKAVIAWNGDKKSVRAVNDAIPLLRGRGEVTVLVVNPKQRGEEYGGSMGDNLVSHLKQHGIEARVDMQTIPDLSIDTILLNYVSDIGADLLIMGAYGHSRLREKAFGGVTESILHQMTVPVLMSE